MAGGDQKVFVRNTSISPSGAGTLTYVDGNTSADRLDVEITSIPASGYHFSHCTATDVTTGEVLTSNVNPSIFKLIDFVNRTTYDVTADIVVYFEKDDTPTSTLTIGGKTVTNISIASKDVQSISINGTIVWEKEEQEQPSFSLHNIGNDTVTVSDGSTTLATVAVGATETITTSAASVTFTSNDIMYLEDGDSYIINASTSGSWTVVNGTELTNRNHRDPL